MKIQDRYELKPLLVRIPKRLYKVLKEISFFSEISMKDIVISLLAERLPDWIETHFTGSGDYSSDPDGHENITIRSDFTAEKQEKIIAQLKELKRELINVIFEVLHTGEDA